MDELFKGLFTAPLATLFIMSGMIFLLIAVIGNISRKVEPGSKARIASGIFGLAFILAGVSIHVMQNKPNPPTLSTVSPTSTKLDQSPQNLEPVPQFETVVVSASTNKKIPDWVPIYPSVKIENLSFREGLEQKQFGSFIFTTQDEEREVVNFYHSQFTSAGWKRDGYNNIMALRGFLWKSGLYAS